MRAAWYERQGAAHEVFAIGAMPESDVARGEVGFQAFASGINPGDVKKRSDEFGVGMPFSRVIPHSDGAGSVGRGGEGVLAARMGDRDFPAEAKVAAANDLNRALAAGWLSFEIDRRFTLDEFADAHACVERKERPGRVVMAPTVQTLSHAVGVTDA